TRQDIKNIITAQYFSMASGLTDSQISTMSQSFRVVPAWLPPTRSTDLMLDSSGPNVSPANFTQIMQLLRSGDGPTHAQASTQIAAQVDNACNILAYALPNDWNVTYYSPYRVYVLAYYLASGDRLAQSYTDCETRMTTVQNWLAGQGFTAPCEGRALWGDAGYMYTRPTSTLFSDSMQSDLLSRYAAVHGLQ